MPGLRPGHPRLRHSSTGLTTRVAGIIRPRGLNPGRSRAPDVHCRLPPRPNRRTGHAGDLWREARDGRRRHPLPGPHRRAARGDGQGYGGRRRLYPIEMPVRARGMVPRQTGPRPGPRTGGEFRQRQCVHRQDRTTGDRADRRYRRQGRRMQRRRGVSCLDRRDRRTARRHQVQRRAGRPRATGHAGRMDGRRQGDHDHRHLRQGRERRP